MIGHPTETLSDIEYSISLIEEIAADRTLLNLVTPLPGTKLVDFAGGLDRIDRTWWKYYFQGKSFHQISEINKSDLDVYFKKMCEWVAQKNMGNKVERVQL